MKKRFLKQLTPALLAALLCGCFQVKDELVLQSDGSGTVRIETKSLLPAEMSEGFGRGDAQSVMYPPVSEREARLFFPEKDFTLKVKEEQAKDGGTLTVIDAGFKDINKLLASPYGRAHGLVFKIENNTLIFKAISGMEFPARVAETKDDKDEFGMMMSGMKEARKKTNEMRFEFRLTLPNSVASANGARDGKTVVWTTERAKVKDSDEFVQKLAAIMEASCPADSLKMAPSTPTRMIMTSFADLQTGTVDAGSSVPDPKKVEQSARFVPCSLQVTRSIDLSGEGGYSRNSAELIGELTIPNEFAPQKWGKASLEEVVDAKGNNLKSGEEREDGFEVFEGRDYETESDSETPASKPDGQKRSVRLQFRPPDWKINEIAKIKGSITLQYFGGAQLLKISNAIPANWIVESNRGYRNGNSSEKKISDPKLKEMGMEMEVQQAQVQSGFTMIMFNVESTESALTDLQIYDAAGKPWPTMKTGFGGSGTQVIVPGRPKGPLSLGMMVSGGGTNISIPILLEKVPVTGK